MRAVAAILLSAPALVAALEPLPDSALAKVAGRDGMSFNLSNFAMSGNAELRYYAPGGGSIGIGNVAASRSDNTDAPFADPYRLDIIAGGAGRADIINIAFPENAAGREVWQVAYDFGVNAGGFDVKNGSVILKDLVYYGGGLQWSTPAVGDGLAFGLAARIDLGSLTLAPNGREATGEAMVLSNVKIGAATADGAAPTAPWRIADVTNQAGIFNARTDAAGNSSLHIGVNWPDADQAAPSGTLQIGNISFRSDAGANMDLGSSRIGSIQLQYLDVKFRQ
ncbi:hypothetical protein NX786_10860 [Telluria mixta]|uniref:PEP-CTERM sorting domain-containing protein n=1 Tax=Telluria mixta TaxID=34071 RepID=A0ABT2BXG3_9BURK|nr:hypothetical protein [Telluria mixta]MCS0629831.1 hypothetical protein [Telluria mixta]WEM96612.1 hypothetical protein P0M04_02345 [Telluria mixta]